MYRGRVPWTSSTSAITTTLSSGRHRTSCNFSCRLSEHVRLESPPRVVGLQPESHLDSRLDDHSAHLDLKHTFSVNSNFQALWSHQVPSSSTTRLVQTSVSARRIDISRPISRPSGRHRPSHHWRHDECSSCTQPAPLPLPVLPAVVHLLGCTFSATPHTISRRSDSERERQG